jgi:hypothetical protein
MSVFFTGHLNPILACIAKGMTPVTPFAETIVADSKANAYCIRRKTEFDLPRELLENRY